MKTLRKTLFWLHLVAGLTAGLIIFVMSLTGAALAFEDEIVAWAERDARQVEIPTAAAPRRSVDELLTTFRSAHPELTPTALTVAADPAAAITFAIGRDTAYYANPYTGEFRQPASSTVAEVMHTLTAWHRWLGREGDGRDVGKAITGASNAAFLVLAITGLYLWWPRAWRWRTLKPSLWFTGVRGKARDWNWHNVFGFWLLVPIVIMSASGIVISYRWAGDLVYRAVGETPPVRRSPGGPTSASAAPAPRPSGPTAPLPLDTLFTAAAVDQPTWTTLSLRLPVRGQANLTVKLPGTWPRTATTTLTVDPTTATIAERATFADQSTGRQLRGWLRFLHTGQALGWVGQLIAGLGCLAGCVLVYTGFALSYRRFFARKATARP